MAAGHAELTLGAAARRDRRVLGSRFIACAYPVATRDEAKRHLDLLVEEFPDATHHCWGIVLAGPEEQGEWSHDAGEPAGTAGRPILQAARSAGLTNLLVAVVRYFGGTKLGKGNLARAYRDAARLAIAAAPHVPLIRTETVRLSGPLALDGEVRHLIARHRGRVESEAYDASVAAFVIVIPAAAAGALVSDLARLTRGAWTARPSGRRRG